MSEGPFRAVMDRVSKSDLNDADKGAVILALAFAETNAWAVICRNNPSLHAVRIQEAQKLLLELTRAMERVKP